MRCSKCNRRLVGNNLTCPHCDYGVEVKEENPVDSKEVKRFEAFSRHAKKRQSYVQKTGFAAIKSYYSDFFNYQGYSGRLEYWTQQLYIFLVSIPLYIVVIFSLLDNISSLGLTLYIIYFVFWVVTMIPSGTATIRRLNDAGYHIKDYFILGYIPIIGGIMLFFATIEPSEK